jgi:hypothetical protein
MRHSADEFRQSGKEDNMKPYKNLGGKSAVTGFELAKDFIKVRFSDQSLLRYTNQSAGSGNVSKMKNLAVTGKGLGTFIEANVKTLFDRKIR